MRIYVRPEFRILPLDGRAFNMHDHSPKSKIQGCPMTGFSSHASRLCASRLIPAILFAIALAVLLPRNAMAHEPCRDGVPHPKINSVVIGNVDPTTGWFQVTIDACDNSCLGVEQTFVPWMRQWSQRSNEALH